MPPETFARSNTKADDASNGGGAGTVLLVGKCLQQKSPEHENSIVKFAAEETVVFLECLFDDFFGQRFGEVECGIIEKRLGNFFEGGLAERGGEGDTGHKNPPWIVMCY